MSSNYIRAAIVAAVMAAAACNGNAVASGDTLDVIAQCESSGNPRASNGSHFGLYQFDMSTWESVGGKGHPLKASPGEQRARAERLMSERGTQPWNASRHCWKGKVSQNTSPKKKIVTVPRKGKTGAKIVQASTSRVHTIQAGQTLAGIARANGTTVKALAAKNAITNPHRIRAGRSIRI